MVTFPDEKQTLTKILCRVFQRLEKTSNLKRMENILVSISCLQHSITVYKMSYWEKLAGNLSDLCIVSCNVRIFIYLGIKIKFQPVYKKLLVTAFFLDPVVNYSILSWARTLVKVSCNSRRNSFVLWLMILTPSAF